jgi:integrase
MACQRIEAVLDYAAVHEDNDRRNPARWKGNLDKVLPAPRKVTPRVHHPAAPYADVPRVMCVLRGKTFLSAYCLRFTILTAARSGEARGAEWSEINLDAKVWTIPASRMKAQKEHSVPLCDEAVQILETMQAWRQSGTDRVFPGARGGLLCDMALSKTPHTVADDVTVHGFRSSFRDWGAELTSIPRAVMEAALAHSNQDRVEAAYATYSSAGWRLWTHGSATVLALAMWCGW